MAGARKGKVEKADAAAGREVVVVPPPQSIELQAVRMFVQCGSIAATARNLSLSVAQVQGMSQQIWWQQEVALLQRDLNAQTEAALTRILDFTLEQLLDRVVSGDVHTRDGKAYRAPMKAQALAQVADIVFTKRQLLRNEPTTIPGDTNKLHALAKKLQALGAKDITILDEVKEIGDGVKGLEKERKAEKAEKADAKKA